MSTTTSPVPNTRQPQAARSPRTLSESLRTLRDTGEAEKTNGRGDAARAIATPDPAVVAK
jgi:hypothetical protein